MNIKNRIITTVTLMSSIALSGAVFAQDSVTTLDEIVVEGKYLFSDKLNSVKTPTPILNVPQSLSIVSGEQIKEQSFQNVGDLLRYTPGLSVSQGEGHRDAIIIRGNQSTSDFYIDGLRDDVQYFRPLYNVEQVEILRGSNALLFGRGGGGGIINRAVKSPSIGEQFSSFNVGGDTFGSYSVGGDMNVEVSENVAFRLNGYYQGLDNHRDFYEGNSFAINPTLKVNFSPTTTGTFSYEYVDDDRVVDRGVPSQNVENGPDVPLIGFNDTFFGSVDENFTTLQANILRGRIDHEFTDQLRGNITVQYADYDKAYQNLYASEEVVVFNGNFAEVELDGYRDTTDRENLIAQANLVGEFNTGSLGHTLLAGVEYGDQKSDNARFDNVFAVNDDDQLFIPFTNPLVISPFSFSSLARDRSSQVKFTSIYVQDQVDLSEQFKVVLGLRYDKFDIDVFDIIENNDGDEIAGDFSRVDEEVTPRYGLIYKPLENMTIYYSYGETFLPQSGDQFLTLNVDSQSTRPQFFENTELGLKWDINQNLSLTTSVFELDRESFTSVDPEDAGEVIIIEGSVTSGFELQLSGNVTDNWSISTGYAYLDGEVKQADGGGSDGNKTRQTPENMFSFWNNIAVNNKLSLALGLTYQDSFFVREDNSVQVPSYTRVDAGAFYQLSDSVKVQLNVENLFDKDYYPDAHSNDNISTGEPLNARLSVNFEF